MQQASKHDEHSTSCCCVDTDAASEMTITGKATVLGLQLGLVSGTGQHAQFEVDDVILIVHNAMASDWQRLGLPGLQIMTMDLALAAARLTVYSAGRFLPLAINVY